MTKTQNPKLDVSLTPKLLKEISDLEAYIELRDGHVIIDIPFYTQGEYVFNRLRKTSK